MTFASLSGPDETGAPQLRIRRRYSAAEVVLSFDVIEYEDSTDYNCEVVFSDADFALDDFVSGVYVCEVDANIGGENVTFPDDGYFLIEFKPGVD